MGKRAIEMTEFCVADALSSGISDLEGLRDEMRDWYDNMPESLQNGDRGGRIQEAAEALDNVDCIALGDELENEKDDNDKLRLGGIRFSYPVNKRRNLSKSARRDEATGLLRAAVEAVRGHLAEKEAAATAADAPETGEEEVDVSSELDELESLIDDAEGVEFPGAYG